MFRRLLVPVDGSAASLASVRHAIALAKDSGARIKLVHVIDEVACAYAHAHGWDMSRVLGGLKAAGAHLFAEPIELAREAGVETESAVIEQPDGPVWRAIVAEAAAWNADLIVIGTHGRRGVRRLMMGSDAESVIRSSPVPVLSVRAPELQAA